MERLTYRDKDGMAMMKERGGWKSWGIDRLAAYEDTGLEPDVCSNYRKFEDEAISKGVTFKRIVELMNADHDGRLVVIPWEAGDVIYEADPAHGVVKHTFAGEPAWLMHSYAVDDAGNEWYDGWGSSDETPFYKTREEAESALALKGGEV